jgi:hypothetical protein
MVLMMDDGGGRRIGGVVIEASSSWLALRLNSMSSLAWREVGE